MKPAIIESPYAGNVERNEYYARACMRYMLMQGYAPFASHLLYTQPGVLDDLDPDERRLGIEAGLVIARSLSAPHFIFEDLGTTPGMLIGMQRARDEGRDVAFMRLPGWKDK